MERKARLKARFRQDSSDELISFCRFVAKKERISGLRLDISSMSVSTSKMSSTVWPRESLFMYGAISAGVRGVKRETLTRGSEPAAASSSFSSSEPLSKMLLLLGRLSPARRDFSIARSLLSDDRSLVEQMVCLNRSKGVKTTNST